MVFDYARPDRSSGRVKIRPRRLRPELGHRFGPPDEPRARFVLDQLGHDREVSTAEAGALADFAFWSALKWHHDRKKTLQLTVDAGPDGVGGREGWAADLAGAFAHFGGARFSILTGSDPLGRDVAALAGRLANVSASGDVGPVSSPMAIGEGFGLRIHLAPMTKVGGFASDASSAEWAYGKLQLARKAMGEALARLVDARFFEEDEIPPLLRQVLHDTPRDLHDLQSE